MFFLFHNSMEHFRLYFLSKSFCIYNDIRKVIQYFWIDIELNIPCLRFFPDRDSTDSLIEQANKEFKQSHLVLACRLYSSAILKSSNTSVRAYLNRAQCHLKLRKHFAAYEDALRASQLEPASEKAFFRLARAAYQLAKYERARDALSKCLELNAGNLDAVAELARTNNRIGEAESGEYNWYVLFLAILSTVEYDF